MSSATKDDQSRVGVRTDGVDLDRLPKACVPEPPNDHYGPLLRQRSYPRPSMPDVVIENPVINSPFVRAPARSDSARSRQGVAAHLGPVESVHLRKYGARGVDLASVVFEPPASRRLRDPDRLLPSFRSLG
jgi:hypothetical protein